MRYGFAIKFAGEVKPIKDSTALEETIDDIRGVILESFKKDLQAGVVVNTENIVIFTIHDIEND